MKYLNIILIFLLIGLISSCEDELSQTIVSESATPPSIANMDDISTEITLSQDLADSTALYLEWEPANFGVNTSVRYVVEMDASGTTFDAPIIVLSTDQTSATITHGQLNSAALNAEIEPLSAQEVRLRVRATLGTENTLTTVSDAFAITLEAYNDIPSFMSDIGIIGSATPGGWDFDTDMEDLGGGNYRLLIELIDGEAKFRQDNDWAVNWGSTDFPSGLGEQDGPNIPVVAGLYEVTFNKNTAAYTFTPANNFPSIGIIGSATPGGWDADTDMFSLDGIIYTLEIELIEGEVKFRQDDDWEINWGGTAFPSGVATLGGDNIAVVPGNYNVTLNIETGEYNFETVSEQIFVGIIGDATPGGWDEDTDLEEVEPGVYKATLDLIVGEAKFRANDDWALNWGGTEFPSGMAVEGGDNIMVNAEGTYDITLDLNTLEYRFEQQLINSVGLIGNATPGGWDADTDLTDNGDGTYTLIIGLTDGEVKFRANDDWAISWGSSDFPSGIGVTENGPNIPVTAGLYNVTFDANTGAYSFTEATIGIIGNATPTGWDSDTDLLFDPATPNVLTLNITLTDGEAKFRANDDWAISWGATDFPMGVGITDNGPNIPVTAGTYDITFNVLTGEYNFQ